MAKVKTAFFCQNCGAKYAKWQGQCHNCKSWNSITEEVIQTSKVASWNRSDASSYISKPLKIDDIETSTELRMDVLNKEFNRVLGGGIVPGSLILLGGEPGIGKSTLILQIILGLPYKSLYVSGEESQKQIKMRAERITSKKSNCYILAETKTQHIFKHITSLDVDIVIIDSIQTLYSEVIESSPGSVSQIKECTSEFMSFAKQTHIPVLLIGHITKDGHIAGPKILEHMVDTVLNFEGDRNHVFRILRAHKNRFGSTNEIGIYEMRDFGLKEINNPNELLISKKAEASSGNAISATLEGNRPLMIEIQTLVGSAVYGTPQRSTTGFNIKRLNMLLAVLEKRAGFKLGAKDVFLNITGGIHSNDPAIDLAVIASIISSITDSSIPNRYCFAAEVGLSGEIRPVSRIEQRILEAERLGFSKIFISEYNNLSIEKSKIKIEFISKIEDLITRLI